MLTPLRSRPQLPESFARWSEVDTVADSELLHRGPSIVDVRSFKKWLAAYERWRSGYEALVRAVGTLQSGAFADDFDRRQYEHYTGLFLQSGQWHAILLLLLEDVLDSARSPYLAEIDGILADLRKKLTRL